MKVIGLTGSIGMGKSMTASLLRNLGVAVHDSDAAVHEALSPRGGAFRDVVKAFPSVLNKRTNTLDRKALGEIVFADPAKRKTLEAIVHPHVWASQQAFIRKSRRMGLKTVVLDIPLLFETGADLRCDKVICVTAPSFLQRQRVLRRPGMDEQRFQGILRNQVPNSEKRRRSHYTVPTGLGRAFTLNALRKIFKVRS